MGFPSSAIDAFLSEDKTRMLSYEEDSKLKENLPAWVTGFRLSKENAEAEFDVIKRWHKLLLSNAPELLDQLYSDPEDVRKFKETIEKL